MVPSIPEKRRKRGGKEKDSASSWASLQYIWISPSSTGGERTISTLAVTDRRKGDSEESEEILFFSKFFFGRKGKGGIIRL